MRASLWLSPNGVKGVWRVDGARELGHTGRRMTVLAFDVCGDTGAVALAEAGHCVAARHFPAGRVSGTQLLPAIHAVLKEAERSPASVETLVLVPGPGSFAGSRIALATAKGLFIGRELKLWAPPGGWLLAQAHFAAQADGDFVDVVHPVSRRLCLAERFERRAHARGVQAAATLLEEAPARQAWHDAARAAVVHAGTLTAEGTPLILEALRAAACAPEGLRSVLGTADLATLMPIYARQAYANSEKPTVS